MRGPDLTREVFAFTQPRRRLAALALIALGTTLTLFGVLAFGVLLSIVVNSGRFVHVLAIPLGMTLLGAVLVRYGIRARPRV